MELISLRAKNINFCKGCMACVETHKCVLKDDANEIVSKMHEADVIVWATPIYYYEMSGQMKTMIDRCNPLYGGNYRFTDIYMLSSAAEDAPETPQRAVSGLQGWIECFGRASLKGTEFAGGVTAPGEIKGHIALAEAYEMGKNV